MLSPTIPVHPRNAPVSPIIPVHTQKQGVGGASDQICSPLTPLFSLAVLTTPLRAIVGAPTFSFLRPREDKPKNRSEDRPLHKKEKAGHDVLQGAADAKGAYRAPTRAGGTPRPTLAYTKPARMGHPGALPPRGSAIFQFLFSSFAFRRPPLDTGHLPLPLSSFVYRVSRLRILLSLATRHFCYAIWRSASLPCLPRSSRGASRGSRFAAASRTKSL